MLFFVFKCDDLLSVFQFAYWVMKLVVRWAHCCDKREVRKLARDALEGGWCTDILKPASI